MHKQTSLLLLLSLVSPSIAAHSNEMSASAYQKEKLMHDVRLWQARDAATKKCKSACAKATATSVTASALLIALGRNIDMRHTPWLAECINYLFPFVKYDCSGLLLHYSINAWCAASLCVSSLASLWTGTVVSELEQALERLEEEAK